MAVATLSIPSQYAFSFPLKMLYSMLGHVTSEPSIMIMNEMLVTFYGRDGPNKSDGLVLFLWFVS